MIKVQLKDRLLGIGFEHKSVIEKDQLNIAYTGLLSRPVLDTIEVRRTYCTLCELTPEADGKKYKTTPLAQGMSRCSPLDNFKKEVGRKMALTRALKTLFPGPKENPELTTEAILMNKNLREAVWKGYHSRWVSDVLKQVEERVS